MENDNKDENHVDDQENDMTNNSKEEEEKTVQNPPIENHDNRRNTEAMEGKLEQSQSILGEQREGDKPTTIMKKQQMTQYLNEKLAENINSTPCFSGVHVAHPPYHWIINMSKTMNNTLF
jgi:hypothetical protein